MNRETFSKRLNRRIEAIRNTLDKKAREYAIGDRLYNFKRAAEIGRVTVPVALKGMWLKHIVSVLDLIEGGLENTEAMCDEKLGDAINYLILLEAVMAEERAKKDAEATKYVEKNTRELATEVPYKSRTECSAEAFDIARIDLQNAMQAVTDPAIKTTYRKVQE